MPEELHELNKPNKIQILWGEGLRSFLCMVPMLYAMYAGMDSVIVSLGQGGFFFSSIPLALKKGPRILEATVLISLGLGYYLMGGNVVFNPLLAVLFTFLVALNIGILSGYKVLGMLALHFISIYTAGLNVSSPEKIHANFLAFIFAFAWGGILSILFNWKGQQSAVAKAQNMATYFISGIRMGVGTSVALFVSYLFGFHKLGWAPSGAGIIIRYDTETSKKLAWARFIATIGGAAMAVTCFLISGNLQFLILMSLVFTVLNGLFKATKIGTMPLFYTATILILYSLNLPDQGTVLAAQRIFYNVVGILIGVLVVLYPFPVLTKRFQERMNVKM